MELTPLVEETDSWSTVWASCIPISASTGSSLTSILSVAKISSLIVSGRWISPPNFRVLYSRGGCWKFRIQVHVQNMIWYKWNLWLVEFGPYPSEVQPWALCHARHRTQHFQDMGAVPPHPGFMSCQAYNPAFPRYGSGSSTSSTSIS